jgi:hypothetical protein
MTIVIPKFRAAGATYVFLANASGSIIAVVYPDGNSFLRATEHD